MVLERQLVSGVERGDIVVGETGECTEAGFVLLNLSAYEEKNVLLRRGNMVRNRRFAE